MAGETAAAVLVVLNLRLAVDLIWRWINGTYTCSLYLLFLYPAICSLLLVVF